MPGNALAHGIVRSNDPDQVLITVLGYRLRPLTAAV